MAWLITVGAPRLRALCLAGDEDWEKFEVVPGTVVRLSAQPASEGTRVLLQLYAPDGTTLLGSNDGGPAGSAITRTLGLGTYYARVTNGAAGVVGPQQTYSFVVTELLPPKRVLIFPNTRRDAPSEW